MPVTHELPRRSLKSTQMTRLLPLLQTPSAAESESLSEICAPVPDAKAGVLSEKFSSVQESRGAGTQSCASTRPARWQRGGQRNQRRKRATTCAEVRTGGFWTTTPSPAHAGRPFHESRWKVESLLERRAVRTLAARRNYQTALGRSSNLSRSSHSLWSKTSKSTVPWLRCRTIGLSREFSITMVHSFLLP